MSGTIGNVQRGLLTLPIDGDAGVAYSEQAIDVPIQPTEANRSAYWFTSRGDWLDVSDAQIRAQPLIDAGVITGLRFSRGAASTPVFVAWQIAEFQQGARVQHLLTDGTVDSGVPVATVDPAHTLLLDSFAVRVDNSSFDTDDYLRVYLEDKNLLSATHTHVAESHPISLQVWEYDGFRVERGLASLLGQAVSQTHSTANQPAFGRVSWQLRPTASAGGGAELLTSYANDGGVTVERGAGGADLDYAWEAVSIVDGTQVLAGRVSLATGQTSTTVTLARPVDPSAAIVFTGGRDRDGTCSQTGSFPTEARATLELSGPQTLVLTRARVGAPAEIDYVVLAWVRDGGSTIANDGGPALPAERKNLTVGCDCGTLPLNAGAAAGLCTCFWLVIRRRQAHRKTKIKPKVCR